MELRYEYLAVDGMASIFYCLSLLSVFLCTVSFIHCMYFRWLTKKNNLPPGTMGYFPLIGETLQFLRLKEKFTFQRHAKYGRVFKTHLFGGPTVRVCGAENVRTVFMGDNHIVQSFWPPSTRALLGSGSLSNSSGLCHRRKKGFVMKTVTPSKLCYHLAHFQNMARDKVEAWIHTGLIDPTKECSDMTMKGVIKFFIRNDLEKSVVSRLIELMFIFEHNLMSIPIDLPGTGFHKGLKARAEMCSIIQTVLLQKSSDIDLQDSTTDFLDHLHAMLLEDNETDAHKVIEDSIIEIMFAGNTTTSTACFCAMYLLANHQTVLCKLRKELNEHGLLSTDGIHYPEVTWDHLKEMDYLQCVIKETLRRMPPVGGVYRKVIKPFQLEGYTIPANWRVVVSIRDHHMGGFTFDKAMSFNPDRWLDHKDNESVFDFIPFGSGSRRCVGKEYAKLSLQYVILELARRAQWKMQPEKVAMTHFPSPKPIEKISAIFERFKPDSEIVQ